MKSTQYIILTFILLLSINVSGQVLNVSGLSSGLPAGGDLTGTYLNPQIAAGVVDSNKLAAMGATSGQILKLSNGKWKPGVDLTSSGTVLGSGTANYMSKWINSTTIGNSIIHSTYRIGVNTTIPSALFSISFPAIGITARDSAGLVLENPTAASVGAQQQSPLIRFASNGWGTTGGTSQPTGWRVYSEPVQGTVPGSTLKFENFFGGAWVTNRINFHSGGIGILTANTTHGLEVNSSSRFIGNVRFDANLRDKNDNNFVIQGAGASNVDLTFGNATFGRMMFTSNEFQWSKGGASFGTLGTYSVNFDAGTTSATALPIRLKSQNGITNGSGADIWLLPGAGAGTGVVGRVGVNTSSPAVQLHVNSGLGVTVGVQRWQNSTLDVDQFISDATPEGAITGAVGDVTNGTTGGVGTAYIKETGAGNTGWQQYITTGNIGTFGWKTSGNTVTAGTQFLGSTNNVSLRFRTNNTQRMVIDSTGKIAIGGATTADLLTLYGKLRVTTKSHIGNAFAPVVAGSTFAVTDSLTGLSKTEFRNKSAAAGDGTLVSITTSSNGTGGDAMIKYSGQTEGYFLEGYDASSAAYKLGPTTTEVLPTTASINILPTGEVGIKENGPTALLHIGSGSTSQAPFAITIGTLVASPSIGTMEFDNNWYNTTGASMRYANGGVIKDFYADQNNTGTGETDLYSFTTIANTLAQDGEKIKAEYAGIFTDVTATGRIRAYFGGNLVYDSGALTLTGSTGSWNLQLTLIKSGSGTVRSTSTFFAPGSSTPADSQQYDLSGLTLTTTNILKVTGTAGGAGGGSNDIVAKLGSIYWYGPAK